jgi:hypothetical protein
MKLTNNKFAVDTDPRPKRGNPVIIKSSFYFRYAGSQDIPIIAYKFSTYPNANKGYDLVMEDPDKIHEDAQASFMYNTQFEDFQNRLAIFISGCNVVYIYI